MKRRGWARLVVPGLLILAGTAGVLAAQEAKTAARPEWNGEELEFFYQNTYDNSSKPAILYKPAGIEKVAKAPLLIKLHYMSGDRFTVRRQGYYQEADKRLWYVLSPELHGKNTPGGRTSWASLEAQHDVIDALETVLRNTPNIDRRRIYLAGRSMGGTLALLMAAKYPDRFAAVVAGQPVTDYESYYRTSVFIRKSPVKEVFLKEMGGEPKEVPFEYRRRSSFSYARNLACLPVTIWAGVEDSVVPREQVELLHREMSIYNPYQPPVNWLVGAPHNAGNYNAAWVCDHLQYYENIAENEMKRLPYRYYRSLDLRTDESKPFFYLNPVLAREDDLGEMRSSIKDGKLAVVTRNLKELTIDLYQAAGLPADRAAAAAIVSRYEVRSDRSLKFIMLYDGQPLREESVVNLKSGEIPWGGEDPGLRNNRIKQ
ncbi:MAG TPA: prolyl oligopeptidase family serine peptidase [bacterium]|nr:prolyl oligopeptidase family serine peptidase [bacterium]